jgi:SAM-dependent methyltransferase
MNEIHRVLKPGGKFYSITPVFPKESVFSDPTHVNFITKNSHKYFTQPHNWASMYGFVGDFILDRVEIVKFSIETSHGWTSQKVIDFILILLFPRFKQHIVWEFFAAK